MSRYCKHGCDPRDCSECPSERKASGLSDAPILFCPLGPMASAEYFGECLVRHNIVDAHALDDPEGYDGYQTIERIGEAYDEITQHLRARAEEALEKVRSVMEEIQSLPNVDVVAPPPQMPDSKSNPPATEACAPLPGSVLCGLRWVAVINGKKCFNGKRYSAKIFGHIEHSEPETTIYEVLCALADRLEEQNAEMEYPDSFQVTLHPRNDKKQALT